MPLTDLASVARSVRERRAGLGAFNVVHLESAERFVAAAEAERQPIVLQISQNAVAYHRRLAPLALATLEIARTASVPVVVHLDHAEDLTLIDQALQLGLTSVMYDGSKLPYDQNVSRTRQVVTKCHERGVSVEAELGEVGGKNGVHDPRARTDPSQAAQFVAQTGIDLLAVAVGSSHAMTSRSAVLDCDLISAIADQVSVPLVLHGSSGASDVALSTAIRAGITKVNVATHLNVQFTAKVRALLAADPNLVDTRKYLGPAFAQTQQAVQDLLRLYRGEP